MTSNSYIGELLAAAHHRDHLEAAEHARLVAQARRHQRVRRRSRSFLRWRVPGPRMTVGSRVKQS